MVIERTAERGIGRIVGSSSPFSAVAGGLRVALRVQPGASRAGIDGTASLDDGETVLKLRVTAPPEDGKANAAVVKLLAKAWKLPKGDLSLIAGQTGRRKALLISGDGAALELRLNTWLQARESESDNTR